MFLVSRSSLAYLGNMLQGNVVGMQSTTVLKSSKYRLQLKCMDCPKTKLKLGEGFRLSRISNVKFKTVTERFSAFQKL